MNVVNKLQQQRYTILNKQYNKIEERIENSNRIMSKARRNDFLKNFIQSSPKIQQTNSARNCNEYITL